MTLFLFLFNGNGQYLLPQVLNVVCCELCVVLEQTLYVGALSIDVGQCITDAPHPKLVGVGYFVERDETAMFE